MAIWKGKWENEKFTSCFGGSDGASIASTNSLNAQLKGPTLAFPGFISPNTARLYYTILDFVLLVLEIALVFSEIPFKKIQI